MYIGDFATGITLDTKFNTQKADGTPITLAGTPSLAVYKDNGTVESTSGLTLTVDFDAKTGLHNARIDTSLDGAFYSSGANFQVMIAAGTVNGFSQVGVIIAEFSLNNRSALRPTTAGRTLDVSAGGEAGLDWANVGSPTTALGLSGTTVKTATDVATQATDIQARLPAALVGGRIDASIGAVAAGVIAAASFAAGALDAVWSTAARLLTAGTNIVLAKGTGVTGFNDLDAAGVRSAVGLASASLDTQLTAIDDFIDTEVASILAAVDTEVAAIKAKTDQLAFTTANRVDSQVFGMQAGTVTAAAIATDAIDADALAADAVTEIRAALNNLSAAQVKTEVVNALSVDTYVEPGQGVPGTTVPLTTKIGFLYKAWRNTHTQTMDEYALFSDDGGTKDQKAVVTDNGTSFVRSKVTTGA